MHLYAIRHAQSYVNLPDWKGDPDASLTPLGQKQAAALAEWLPAHIPHLDAIYSSTMRRPRETVAGIASVYGLTVNYEDRLREIGEVQWNHEPYPAGNDPKVEDWIYPWPTIDCPPFAPVERNHNSETPMHMRVRIGLVLETLLTKHIDQHVLVMSHGGVMSAMFDYCFGVGPWRHCDISTYNTGISHFQYTTRPPQQFWVLRAHNMLEHLRGVDDAPYF